MLSATHALPWFSVLPKEELVFCHNDLGMSGHHATVLVVLSDYHLEKPYIHDGHFITNLSGGQVLTMGVSVLS